MQNGLPVRHATCFEHFTYVVYITTDEQNVHKTNAHVANENIRQFAKPFLSRVQSTQHKRVCGEQKHSPIRQTLSINTILAHMQRAKTFVNCFVWKPIIVKAYQYFDNLVVILSILRFQIFMLVRVRYGE